MKHEYMYKATVLKVVDGDTIDVMIDLGFMMSLMKRVRLYGIDAPERFTEEGILSTQYITEAIIKSADYKIMLETIKDDSDKYGRLLGIIYPKREGTENDYEPVSINENMVELGFAQWKWITDEQKKEHFG